MSIDIPVFNRNQGEIASATGERLQATRQREFLETTIKRDVAVAFRYEDEIERLRVAPPPSWFGERSAAKFALRSKRVTRSSSAARRAGSHGPGVPRQARGPYRGGRA